MEQGFEPNVRKYFIKILNSFSYGFLWLFGSLTAGLYFGLAYEVPGRSIFFTVMFYLLCAGTLALLLRYYYRSWKTTGEKDKIRKQ